MSRPSFLRIGEQAVNVDRIQWISGQPDDDQVQIRFFDGESMLLNGLTLDDFEQTLRDAGRDVATVDGAA